MINFEPHPTDPDKLVIKTQKYHIAKYTEEELQAAVLAEREACAKASERQIERWVDDRARYAASECAAAIRERMK